MIASLGADLVVIAHLCFILFVVLGGFLTWVWPKMIWVHVPVALWGAIVEIVPSQKPGVNLCPLTQLENYLRRQAGQSGYEGGFIEHYIEPIVYPPGLTPAMQLWLGIGVVLINTIVYTVFVLRRKKRRSRQHG